MFLAAGSLAGASFLLHDWPRLYRNGRRTAATVVGHRTDRSDSGDPMYAPVFRFTTEDGQAVEAASSVFTSRKVRVGQEIQIVYASDDAERTAERVGDHRWKLAMGLLFLVLGTGLLIHTVLSVLS
ncbi:hypothetical protein GCM10010182_49640 [Actinomadura cremea]|nr:hypothetical protein GCM10010182_49640 [Actinomadura cremea]